MNPTDPDLRDIVDRLVQCRAPWFFGVRHHAPSLARILPDLLDQLDPPSVLIELPEDLQAWIPWLGDPRVDPPVALSAAPPHGAPWFYPFDVYSPELAAIRWAAAAGRPVVAIDLPTTHRSPDDPAPPPRAPPSALARHQEHATIADWWEHAVEAHADHATAASIRRAALTMGVALRLQAEASGSIDPSLHARDRWMARHVANAPPGSACIVGAMHVPALLEVHDDPPPPLAWADTTTALVPWRRSLMAPGRGYGAGIDDPTFQVVQAQGDPHARADGRDRILAAVCRRLRAAGAPASTPDLTECLRAANDLARLRCLPSPGRSELHEAITLVLGDGRDGASSRLRTEIVDAVMCAEHVGSLPPGIPEAGLLTQVRETANALGLPTTPHAHASPFRLDPARRPLDARRDLFLRRLEVLGVPYGTPQAVQGRADAPAVTLKWSVRWDPSTTAILTERSAHGATLVHAVTTWIASRFLAPDASALALAEAVRRAHLPALWPRAIDGLLGPFLATAPLPSLLEAMALVEDPWPPPPDEPTPPEPSSTLPFLRAALAQLGSLTASTDLADTHAVAILVRRMMTVPTLGHTRLRDGLRTLRSRGSPCMQGAASVLWLHLHPEDEAAVCTRLGSWIDDAGSHAGRQRLSDRLRGLLTAAWPEIDTAPERLAALVDRVDRLPDPAFYAMLPALRRGIEPLSVADRTRLAEHLGGMEDATGRMAISRTDDPDRQAHLRRIDDAGHRAARRIPGAPPAPTALPETSQDLGARTGLTSRPDRWHLILAVRQPTTQDSLWNILHWVYGAGTGEGSHRPSQVGGHGVPRLTPRTWRTAVDANFDDDIVQELIVDGLLRGRRILPDGPMPPPAADAALLARVLSVTRDQGPDTVARLRPFILAMVDALTDRLRTELRPAMGGAAVARSCRRRTGRLDLARTVRANLKTVTRDPEGRPRLTPNQLWWRARAQRQVPWTVWLLVDVSGSMEASAVQAAILASILHNTQWAGVHFLAFSTSVVDLSGHLADPLDLLLSMSIGGGTHIAHAVAYARAAVVSPRESAIVVLSDFHEGGPVDPLVRQVESAVADGIRMLGVAPLGDDALTANAGVATALREVGMPVASTSPRGLVRWIAEGLR